MTSRKIVVEITVRKIDIDWERVYSGFVASGLSLREFHRLHFLCPQVSIAGNAPPWLKSNSLFLSYPTTKHPTIVRLRPPNGNPLCVKTPVKYGAAACCLISRFGLLSSCRNLPAFFFSEPHELGNWKWYGSRQRWNDQLDQIRGASRFQPNDRRLPVSYTHLTLPTNREV